MAKMTFPQSRQTRRAGALKRMRSAARADGVAPARIGELEAGLLGAFAIRDLMDAFAMPIAPRAQDGDAPPQPVIPGEHHAKHGAREFVAPAYEQTRR